LRQGHFSIGTGGFQQLQRVIARGDQHFQAQARPTAGVVARLIEHRYFARRAGIGFATAAGFKPAGASEINANPKDSADWANGVWTLPPNYALKDVDRAKYAAIGESDRMTLKFVKPR
jgi:predicted methyltransferase